MRGMRWWGCALVGLICALTPLVARPSAALGRSTLTWRRTHVDGKATRARELALRSLVPSCVPGGTLCLVVDNLGDAMWSSDITAPKPRWRLGNVDHSPSNGSLGLNSVSCPSSSLCVAVDDDGDVLSSMAPWAKRPSWRSQQVDDRDTVIYGIYCQSTSLCVAVDNLGNILSSTDPTAARAEWSFQNADGTGLIADVSCPSASLCVAVDSEGDTLISSDPTAAMPTWTIVLVDQRAGFASIDCPSVSLCVAGDTKGNVEISTDPSAPEPTWKLANIDGISTKRFGLENLSVGCAPAGTLCVAGDFAGRVMTTTDPSAPRPTWSVASVDGKGNAANAINGVSCPSASLCVLGDSAGNVLIGRR